MTTTISTVMSVVVPVTEIVVLGMVVDVAVGVGVGDIITITITEDSVPHPRRQVLAPQAPPPRIQTRLESLRQHTEVLQG